MFNTRSDLPLERDGQGRYLPWLIAFMVYLAILALAGVMALNKVTARWDKGVGQTLTVQVALGENQTEAEALDAALGVLDETPGIAQTHRLEREQVAKLLEPWLGRFAEDMEDLPLPLMIDVQLASKIKPDLDRLKQRLDAAVPGALVDDHRLWLDRLIDLMQAVELLAGTVLILIGLACGGTVVFTTRTGLAIHREAIEVLHLIGAQDSYIARQFAGRALALGLKGGLLGLGLALPTLTLIGYLANTQEQGLLPTFTPGLYHWAAILALPVAAGLIAMMTARFTVTGTLGRMP